MEYDADYEQYATNFTKRLAALLVAFGRGLPDVVRFLNSNVWQGGFSANHLHHLLRLNGKSPTMKTIQRLASGFQVLPEYFGPMREDLCLPEVRRSRDCFARFLIVEIAKAYELEEHSLHADFEFPRGDLIDMYNFQDRLRFHRDRINELDDKVKAEIRRRTIYLEEDFT